MSTVPPKRECIERWETALHRFASNWLENELEIVRLQEREACAKLVECFDHGPGGHYELYRQAIAMAIRVRSE